MYSPTFNRGEFILVVVASGVVEPVEYAFTTTKGKPTSLISFNPLLFPSLNTIPLIVFWLNEKKEIFTKVECDTWAI